MKSDLYPRAQDSLLVLKLEGVNRLHRLNIVHSSHCKIYVQFIIQEVLELDHFVHIICYTHLHVRVDSCWADENITFEISSLSEAYSEHTTIIVAAASSSPAIVETAALAAP